MNLEDLVVATLLGMLITALDLAGSVGLWS